MEKEWIEYTKENIPDFLETYKRLQSENQNLPEMDLYDAKSFVEYLTRNGSRVAFEKNSNEFCYKSGRTGKTAICHLETLYMTFNVSNRIEDARKNLLLATSSLNQSLYQSYKSDSNEDRETRQKVTKAFELIIDSEKQDYKKINEKYSTDFESDKDMNERLSNLKNVVVNKYAQIPILSLPIDFSNVVEFFNKALEPKPSSLIPYNEYENEELKTDLEKLMEGKLAIPPFEKYQNKICPGVFEHQDREGNCEIYIYKSVLPKILGNRFETFGAKINDDWFLVKYKDKFVNQYNFVKLNLIQKGLFKFPYKDKSLKDFAYKQMQINLIKNNKPLFYIFKKESNLMKRVQKAEQILEK